MRVAVVGSGGREHAIAWKVASSPLVDEVLCLPGNPGTAKEPKTRNIPLASSSGDVAALGEQLVAIAPDLVVVGPEQPLVLGLSDDLRNAGLAVVGPGRLGARLEASKDFAKVLMRRIGIPTARSFTATSREEALDAIEQFDVPPVVKADGLAAGKGVVVADSFDEARAAVDAMMVDLVFGEAGGRLVIEERLIGVEASYIVLTDGHRIFPLTSSQDHKRLLDGDEGPNTGGMGAFAPTPHLDRETEASVRASIIAPVLRTLREDGVDYRGFLYAGLMLTAAGPKVLEFNVRLGDPETQAILFGLDDDLVPALRGVASGDLGELPAPRFSPSATIVMAAEGYPTAPRKGDHISGIDAANAIPGVKVFQAGTAADGMTTRTAGGRVLAVTARGSSLNDAVAKGYTGVAAISFQGAQHRTDIGLSMRNE